MNLYNSKNGMGKSIIAMVAFLFIFGFLSMLGYLLLNEYTETFYATGYNSSQITYVGDTFLWSIGFMDWVIVFLMFFLILGIGITSYKIASPPAFFIVQFVVGIFYGLIAYFFNYMFQEIVGNVIFDATRLQFPNTILICTNLHWIALAGLIIGSLTLYGKGKAEKGQFVE